MAANNADQRAALRSAIEGLLRTCVDLERQAADAGKESRKQVNRVANQLVGLRLPDLKGLADEVAGIGKVMEGQLSRTLTDGRRPYAVEIHRLLDVLAPLHGLGPIPPLLVAPTATPGGEGLRAQFPAGFAQDYIRDLLTGVDGGVNLQRDDASRTHTTSSGDIAAAKAATRGGFSDVHADEGMTLLENATCHAVERHGSQIPDQNQLARLIWLKDPAGEYTWQILPPGSVATNHRCGLASGGFTSPEALAKPIEALLAMANSHGGMDTFLTREAGEATRIGIHVSAELAGLKPGDASGYRGAGIGTKETRSDWLAARQYGLEHGRSSVFAVRYDPIARGDDPGATLAFKKVGKKWHLVTCFPVDEQGPTNKRLEDLT